MASLILQYNGIGMADLNAKTVEGQQTRIKFNRFQVHRSKSRGLLIEQTADFLYFFSDISQSIDFFATLQFQNKLPSC